MTDTTDPKLKYADNSKAIVDLANGKKTKVKDLLATLVAAIDAEMIELDSLAPELSVTGMSELRAIVANVKQSLAVLERTDPMAPMPMPMPLPPVVNPIT